MTAKCALGAVLLVLASCGGKKLNPNACANHPDGGFCPSGMICDRRGNQSRCVPMDASGDGTSSNASPARDGGMADSAGEIDMSSLADAGPGMCPAGHTWTPPSCVDIDECATNNGGCGDATCMNTAGSRTCTCKAGLKWNGMVCQDDDASLKALAVSSGTLGPPFASDTLNYTVSLPVRTPSVTVTATVTSPMATLTIQGASVASGSPSGPLDMGLGPNTVKVEVKAASGTVRTYTVLVQRTVRPDGQVKSTPPFSDANFGESLSISGDYAAVGAPRELEFTGAVYVFKRENGSWVQTAAVKSPNSRKYDSFGASVSLTGDVLVVGAATESSETKGIHPNVPSNTNAASFSGAVFVFRRSGETWPLEAYIKASDGTNEAQFGRAVSMSGEYLAVGAPEKSGPGGEAQAGAIYLFRRSGTTWSATAGPLFAPDPAANAWFGNRIALSAGNLAAAAPKKAQGAASEAGAVYVLKKGAGESWSMDGTPITLTGPSMLDRLGNALAWATADTLAVGAPGRQNTGAVHLFKLSGSTWELQGTPIKASDTSGGDGFGDALAISGDVMAVGAPGKSGTGAAYLFRRTGTAWTQDGTALRPSGLSGDDRFGNAVGLGQGTLAVGAPGDDAPTSATNNTVFFYSW